MGISPPGLHPMNEKTTKNETYERNTNLLFLFMAFPLLFPLFLLLRTPFEISSFLIIRKSGNPVNERMPQAACCETPGSAFRFHSSQLEKPGRFRKGGLSIPVFFVLALFILLTFVSQADQDEYRVEIVNFTLNVFFKPVGIGCIQIDLNGSCQAITYAHGKNQKIHII